MNGEKGFSLMEVVISIALLGVVAVAFLQALATGSKAIAIADERATAESLARAQIEYVRGQEYCNAHWDYTVTSSEVSSTDPPEKNGNDWEGFDSPPLLTGDYETYIAIVNTDPLSGSIDNGIQVISVTVQHVAGGETEDVLTLEGYRAQRGM